MGTYFYIFLRIPTIFDINKRDGCKDRFRLQNTKHRELRKKGKRKVNYWQPTKPKHVR